jgi:hypothetical protein
MTPQGKQTKRVDQKVIPDTSTPPAAKPEASERSRTPGVRKEDWISNQLRRVYDQALHEAIPKDMLDLLDELDDADPNDEDRG